MRIGHGYDIHKLIGAELYQELYPGRAEPKFILGGIEIPHDKFLAGHSDADVLIHAIIDALLGAAALAAAPKDDYAQFSTEKPKEPERNFAAIERMMKRVEREKKEREKQEKAKAAAEEQRLKEEKEKLRDMASTRGIFPLGSRNANVIVSWLVGRGSNVMVCGWSGVALRRTGPAASKQQDCH